MSFFRLSEFRIGQPKVLLANHSKFLSLLIGGMDAGDWRNIGGKTLSMGRSRKIDAVKRLRPPDRFVIRASRPVQRAIEKSESRPFPISWSHST